MFLIYKGTFVKLCIIFLFFYPALFWWVLENVHQSSWNFVYLCKHYFALSVKNFSFRNWLMLYWGAESPIKKLSFWPLFCWTTNLFTHSRQLLEDLINAQAGLTFLQDWFQLLYSNISISWKVFPTNCVRSSPKFYFHSIKLWLKQISLYKCESPLTSLVSYMKRNIFPLMGNWTSWGWA